VTERLWTELTGRESVVIADWPAADTARADAAAEKAIAQLQAVVSEVRRFRSDQGVKPSQKVPARLSGGSVDEPAVRALLRLTEPEPDFTVTGALTTAVGVRVEFDLSGAIDVPAERARLAKDLAAQQKERDVNKTKLLNDNFVSKAPEAVIAKVRDRLVAAEAEIERISAALDALPSA
jgi:valyl-tRNA synthetase